MKWSFSMGSVSAAFFSEGFMRLASVVLSAFFLDLFIPSFCFLVSSVIVLKSSPPCACLFTKGAS